MGDISAARGSTRPRVPIAVKIVIAGGVGVGKNALVSSLSEIGALRTSETATPEELGLNVEAGSEPLPFDALDFGRITIDDALILYLFDTPEQSRHWYYRDAVTLGALGAVVLVDPNRLGDAIPTIDFFRNNGTPYLVAISGPASPWGRFQLDRVRRTLGLAPQVPVAHCDPWRRESGKKILLDLIDHIKIVVSGRHAATVSA